MQGSTQWERSHRSPAVRPLGVPPAVIWLCAGAVLMLMSVPRLGAQDPLASARSLYASAAYDEALKTLQELSSEGGGRIAGASFREVEEYRFLCLLALGRNSEARESISAVVTADPLYKLDENTTSPRVLNAFRTVRREVLPDILHEHLQRRQVDVRRQGLQGRRAAVPQGDRPGGRSGPWRQGRRSGDAGEGLPRSGGGGERGAAARLRPRRRRPTPAARAPARWQAGGGCRRCGRRVRRRRMRRRAAPIRIARSSRRSRRRAKSFRRA